MRETYPSDKTRFGYLMWMLEFVAERQPRPATADQVGQSVRDAARSLVEVATKRNLRGQRMENYTEAYKPRTLGVVAGDFYNTVLQALEGNIEPLRKQIARGPSYQLADRPERVADLDRVLALLGDPGSGDDSSVERDVAAADETARARRRGQGFSADPEFNNAVEKRAMVLARDHFEEAGWDVEDTSANRPYDLRCHRGAETLFVEVKGTTGDSSEVSVTFNEVEQTRLCPGQSVLFVVSGITVERGDAGLTGLGGEVKILDPWRPLEVGVLKPITYRYTLPG